MRRADWGCSNAEEKVNETMPSSVLSLLLSLCAPDRLVPAPGEDESAALRVEDAADPLRVGAQDLDGHGTEWVSARSRRLCCQGEGERLMLGGSSPVGGGTAKSAVRRKGRGRPRASWQPQARLLGARGDVDCADVAVEAPRGYGARRALRRAISGQQSQDDASGDRCEERGWVGEAPAGRFEREKLRRSKGPQRLTRNCPSRMGVGCLNDALIESRTASYSLKWRRGSSAAA